PVEGLAAFPRAVARCRHVHLPRLSGAALAARGGHLSRGAGAMRRMPMRMTGMVPLLLAALWAGSPASAARIDPEAAFERSGAAIGRLTSDHRLFRSDATPFNLSVLRGRPLVVSLVYTSCSTVCPVGTQTLKSSVAQAR